MPVLPICCGERDLTFPLKLADDLVIELALVGLHGQGNVGALLETPAKKLALYAEHPPRSAFVPNQSCSAAA